MSDENTAAERDYLSRYKRELDLALPNDDRAFGNCDLCFLKGRGMIERVLRHSPDKADWWVEQEQKVGGLFRKDRPSYGTILHQVRIQPQLFTDDDDLAIPCTCTD